MSGLNLLVAAHEQGRHSFRYQGSLTTPPCSQIVTWNVNTNGQIGLFAEHYANNARPLQPLNRRFLLVDDAE